MRFEYEDACAPRFMRRVLGAAGLAAALVGVTPHLAGATVASVKPQYLPPSEVLQFLGARPTAGSYTVSLMGGHEVQIRLQDTANLLLLQGDAADVQAVQELIRAADVAPRQIVLDAQIVAVNEAKARDAGIVWPDNVSADGFWRWQQGADHQIRSSPGQPRLTARDLHTSTQAGGQASFNARLALLDAAGASRTRTVPRIVTLNNRRATILDGTRAVYVARFGSYTNLFVTDSLDAGVTLSVLPSVGESGYLRLSVRAEMSHIRGFDNSLAKDGQMIENEVIAKDGEPVLLGGFDSESDSHQRSGLPLLGRLIPYLFSHKSSQHSAWRTYLILTPHIVDLASTVDGGTKSGLDDK